MSIDHDIMRDVADPPMAGTPRGVSPGQPATTTKGTDMTDTTRLSASWEHLPCISAAWSKPHGNRIQTTEEAGSMSEICDEWRIVARRVRTGEWMMWEWRGAFGDQTETYVTTPKGNPTIKIIPGPERKLFYSQQERGPISTVQGRDHDDVICLYARTRPILAPRKAA